MGISRVIFNDAFGGPHVFLAVVHTTPDEDQALQDVAVAHDNGADGVFLINHDISSTALFHVYEKVREVHPNYWVGLNCLRIYTLNAVRLAPQSINGLWSDQAHIHGDIPGDGVNNEEAIHVFDEFNNKYKDGKALYFGGVAFKHQPQPTDLARATSCARKYMDVVTTSGDQTGKPPTITKISTMSTELCGHPFAIASGMTPANVRQYMPFVDCFLVNTGIADANERLVPKRVHDFARALGK